MKISQKVLGGLLYDTPGNLLISIRLVTASFWRHPD